MPPWKRTMPICSTPLLLCLLCVTLSTVHALFGVRSSRGVRSTTGYRLDPASPQGVTQQAFDRAASHSTVKQSVPHINSHVHSDSSRENSASAPEGQDNESGEPLSSNSARRLLNDASETAQDIWRVLNPSTNTNKLTKERANDQPKHAESDPVSLDDAIQHVRAIIHILSRTHNALLEKKLAKLPFLQRIWFKLFYSHGDPLLTRNEPKQEQKGLSTMSRLVNSARDFASISENTNVVRENINAVTTTFARETLLSLSALKDAAQNAAHGGWLVTPQVKAYADELTQRFATNSEKWMRRIIDLSEAAKPVTGTVVSKEYVQDLLRDMEDMLLEFKDEMWRMRTEWVYKRSETFSRAAEILFAMKQLGEHQFERLSNCLYIRGKRVKHALKEGFRGSRAHAAYLLQLAAERVNDFIGLLEMWIRITKEMLTTFARMLKYYNSKTWRVLAFVAVIILYRFLLNLVNTDSSLRHYISGAFSRTGMSSSPLRSTASTQGKRPATPPSASSARSEISESNPTLTEHPSEDDVTPDTSNRSHVSETASFNNDIAVSSTVQRQKRRTPSRKAKAAGEPRPLQTLNFDYQVAPCTLKEQEDGQPIRIGDHEVKLVYRDAPNDALTDDSRNSLGGKQGRKATKNTRCISRREDEKLAPERRTIGNGDDDTSGTSSNFETANSRQTRSEARRSARRSHMR